MRRHAILPQKKDRPVCLPAPGRSANTEIRRDQPMFTIDVTRWFKRQQPEPVMSSAEMRRELQHCTTALAEARGRLELEDLTPYEVASQRLGLLQIARRLDALRDRLDEVEGPQYTDDDLIMLGRIQERARVMNERLPERGGRQ